MTVEKATIASADVDQKPWYRVGGIAALVLGTAYIIIVPLYAHVGAAPIGGEAWFKYLPGKTTVWWVILGLSVLTDFLFVPVAFVLYLALKAINRNAMLLATAFVGLFVVLDLAVTWYRHPWVRFARGPNSDHNHECPLCDGLDLGCRLQTLPTRSGVIRSFRVAARRRLNE